MSAEDSGRRRMARSQSRQALVMVATMLRLLAITASALQIGRRP